MGSPLNVQDNVLGQAHMGTHTHTQLNTISNERFKPLLHHLLNTEPSSVSSNSNSEANGEGTREGNSEGTRERNCEGNGEGTREGNGEGTGEGTQ